MLKAKVLEVFRKTNNVIYGYRLQDESGNIKDVTPEQLKNAIRGGLIHLNDYKLTSDNRLVKNKNELNTFNPIDTDKYLIMNKDNAVAEFDLYWKTIEIYGKMPYSYTTLDAWLKERAKFSCAHDVKEFFKTIGIEKTADMIDVTHCVSLHDSFWVKRTDSTLTWKNVSPFRNDYSKVISTYALEGVYIGKDDKNYFSPVVGTDGSFPHTWKYSPYGITFIKAGSKYTVGGGNSGREPFSEYYASVISDYLGFNHVRYTIRNHVRHDKKIDVVTECKCFTSEDIGTVTAYSLGLKTYEDVIEYCKKLSVNAYDTIIDMLFLDCLLLNTDRHFSNIEFFIDNDTLEVKDIAPIFDNNYSFLPRFIEGYDTFTRKDYVARDDRSFEDLYKLVKKHKTFKKELIKLKNLKLTKPENVEISDTRIAFLNNFLQCQVNYLLQM